MALGAVVVSAVLLASAGRTLAQGAGEETYKANCQMCHGERGAADTPAGKAMGAKSFKGPELPKMSNAAVMAIIKNGSGRMPAFKDRLTDGQIKDVLTFIREFQEKAAGDAARAGK